VARRNQSRPRRLDIGGSSRPRNLHDYEQYGTPSDSTSRRSSSARRSQSFFSSNSSGVMITSRDSKLRGQVALKLLEFDVNNRRGRFNGLSRLQQDSLEQPRGGSEPDSIVAAIQGAIKGGPGGF